MIHQSSNQASDPADAKDLKLVAGVMHRLNSRARLWRISKEIFAGLSEGMPGKVAKPRFVTELELSVNCNEDKPNATVNFSCSETGFDCVALLGAFDCIETYNSCGKDDFSCGKTMATSFECDKDVFDCHDFVCGDPAGGVGAFDCSAIDFQCTGPDFDCHDDFDCTGEHVFMCWEFHECLDNFDCSNKGEVECDPPGSPNECSGNYHRPDQGGDDIVPGDFACGIKIPNTGNDNSKFDCVKEFACSAKDEFDCAESTVFRCGFEGDFDCDATTNFECDGGPGAFGCVEGNFECGGAAPGTDGVFDCGLNFSCFKDYDCANDFDCNNTEFTCDPTSGFDCVVGEFTCIGKYTIPD